MKDLTWLKQELIAHRGFYKKNGAIPENSMAAFKRALDHGYAIECDIQLTKDHEVVVFHDENLKRLTGLNQPIHQVTYEQIKTLNLLLSNEKIPLLRDVLNLVKGKVPLLIELKPFGPVKKLCTSTMALMKDYQGKYAVFSFHPGAVLWFKKYHPHVIRGQISSFFDDDTHVRQPLKFLMKRLFFNHFTKPDFISYDIHNLPNKHVDKQKKKGITIMSYAARSQAELDFVKSYYDNVVFEYFTPIKNA